MITEKVKARAIARLKHSEDPKTIADELELPIKLVQEWQNDLPEGDLIALEANVHAIETIAGNEGQLVTPINSEILKNAIEETALDITKAMAIPALNGDVVHAKALESMSNGLAKMYQVIVLKGGVIEHDPTGNPSNSGLSVFEGMMSD